MIKRVDENGNVRLITNIRKPRKWRRYEYLLSSGTLYIDTGYKPNGDTRVIMKFLYTSYNSPSSLFGARNKTSESGANNFNLWCLSNLFGAQYNGNDWTANLKSVDLGTSEPFIVDYNKNICTVKGVSATFTKASFTVNYNLLLLALLDASGVDNRKSAGKLYYCKVYDNDVLIRDFVPAQYNGQYGMWDLVEDRFYGNSGTGTFTVGPEVKNYDEIYEVRKTTSLLPSGVELYDYILSNGTLYIDTGWITDYTKSFEVESKYNASFSGSRACILSNHYATNSLSLEVNLASRYWLHGGNIDNSITITMGADHTSIFSYGGGTWKHQVDGGTANTGSASYSDSVAGSAWMFCDRALRTTTFNKIFKMYYLSIKENGVLIRNFLPCTYLGEPGMWDTVENKFYRNQGTGLFTLGNKITLKEYEYLLGDGNSWINSGFIPSSNTNNYVRYMLTGGSGSAAIFGEDTTWLKQNYTLWSRHGFTFGTQDPAGFTSSNNVEYTHELKNKQWFVNSTLRYTFTDTFQAIYPIHIFGNSRGNKAASERFVGNLYELKFWESGTLVRDFIPVSYNGTPGLWDKVEWKFYANAGSGSFTLGPEKASGIFPISFGTLEYSEGSNISSSLLTVTGSGKTSTPPRAAINACTDGYKVEFSNVSVTKTYVIELDFTWTGNWGFTSDGSPILNFLGATKASGGSYAWGSSNYITTSLNNRQSLLRLVQSSPSRGKYHYIAVFTIPANARVGYAIGTRCDYSDGNGSFTYGNLKIYSYN